MYEKRPQRAGNAQLLALLPRGKIFSTDHLIAKFHLLSAGVSTQLPTGAHTAGHWKPEELGRHGYKNSGSRHQKSAYCFFR